MRSILLGIMFCLIYSFSWGQTVLWGDLIENPSDGLVYKRFLTMPFTGTVPATANDPVQRSYKYGSKHGEWVEFDANGLVKSKSKFVDGRLKSKSKYKDGKETTEFRFNYFKSGQLKGKSTWKNGKEYGLREVYFENGQSCRRCALPPS
jgi:antitoxin component YwqK of YwqJK toxin-antitoxin module